MVDELFFPMLQLGHDGFHMGANLFGGPGFAGHMLNAEVDQLFLAGIGELAAGIAPLTVVLVEGTVGVLAGGGIVERHSAALADKLPRRAQQRVDGNVEEG